MAPLPANKARKHRAFLLGLFFLLVLSSALVTYFMLMPFSKFSTTPRSSARISGLLRAAQTSSRIASFANSRTNLNHDHDALWEADVPSRGGFLVLSQHQHQTSRVGIAMFHQLRCLAVLRSEMQRLRAVVGELERNADADAGVIPRKQQSATFLADASLARNEEDVVGCFDYLRQSILCLSDVTTERLEIGGNGTWTIPSVDNLGERTCRDWDILYRASRMGGLGDDL